MGKGIRVFLMPFTCKDIIEKLDLEPLPLEGGFYKRTYESSQTVDLGKGYAQPLGTGIYFLLTPDSFSSLHWLMEDEVYHFYLGDPVELFQFSHAMEMKKTILGQDLMQGQVVQHTVLKNCWQGSRLAKGGNWALLGTTMAPGFVWNDFQLGNRNQLLSEFPNYKEFINELTRE